MPPFYDHQTTKPLNPGAFFLSQMVLGLINRPFPPASSLKIDHFSTKCVSIVAHLISIVRVKNPQRSLAQQGFQRSIAEKQVFCTKPKNEIFPTRSLKNFSEFAEFFKKFSR